MSERQTASSVSSLAINERRESTTHRPGGCVSIFFQLFDWNRRLAKKKLFSKKLLPPARSKQASKRFGGDDKMPKTKLHLIADDNSRGFPGVANRNGSRGLDHGEQKHEMKVAGLVARLMGLESMPAVVSRDEKPQKGSDFVNNKSIEERLSGCYEGSTEDMNVAKGGTKGESRPLKLQKTGQFDRQMVHRLGAEALQIKGVLSRSRKHHHPKLATPKSPRLASAQNASRTSRLIDAASRILEPGLQATNRAKSSITYSTRASYASSEDVFSENFGNDIMLPDLGKQKLQEQPNSKSFEGDICNSLTVQASCKNCGNLVDSGALEPSCTALSDVLSLESDTIKPRRLAAPFVQEREIVNQRGHDHIASFLSDQEIQQPCVHEVVGGKSPSQEGQAQWHLRSQPWQTRATDSSRIGYQQRIQLQNGKSSGNRAMLSRERIVTLQTRRASAAENAQNRTKDFVALNRSLSGQTRMRVPSRTKDSAFATEKMAPVRKRRTVGLNSQVESKGLADLTTVGRQRNPKTDLASEKGLARNYLFSERPNLEPTSCSPGECNRPNDNQAGDAVAFRFSSQLRNQKLNDTGPRWMAQIDESTLHQRQQAMDETDGNTTFHKSFPLKGAALGELLEQKIRELASEEYDQTIKGALHKRSTAAILQELIAALASERPSSPSGQMFSSDKFQTEGRCAASSINFSNNGDHLSPGSVLEASFSNDSCISGSFNDSSGCRQLPDCLDYPYDWRQAMETKAETVDSAIILHEQRAGVKVVNDYFNHITEDLRDINLACGGSISGKLTHAKEIIMNAEFVFKNAILPESDSTISSLLRSCLLKELNTLASATWTNISCLGYEKSKESTKLRRFLFDCLVECLDVKYGFGFKLWRRVPLHMNATVLIQDFAEEVQRWANFSGMMPDEIIEWEMSHSLGKWTDFEVEAFENVAEIGKDILQILVQEVIIDLWECRMAPF